MLAWRGVKTEVSAGFGLMRIQMLARGVEVLAPAKINLFLEVLGRRSDGYHEIETLMVAVDLHDRLTFENDPSGAIALGCDDPTLPVDDQNLVVRAAKRLKAEAGGLHGARIVLEKRIPTEAGLGGGSSDAAATLVALDRLWNLGLPSGRLDELAGEIGGDVAFFRHTPAAVCRGRGEAVEPVSMPNPMHFVLVRPPFGMSTALVYRQVAVPTRPRPLDATLRALEAGDPVELGSCLFNRLQAPAESLRPELVRVKSALAELSPPLCGSLMSGSGSTYFGVGRDLEAARHAASILESLGLGWVRVVTSCSQAENAS